MVPKYTFIRNKAILINKGKEQINKPKLKQELQTDSLTDSSILHENSENSYKNRV